MKYKNEPLFENRKDAVLQVIEQLPVNISLLNNIIVLGVSEGGAFFAN